MGLSSSHNHSFSRPHLSTWCAGGQTSSLKANFQNWVCASCRLVCQCELGGTYPFDHLEAYICSNTCLISIHEQCIPAPLKGLTGPGSYCIYRKWRGCRTDHAHKCSSCTALQTNLLSRLTTTQSLHLTVSCLIFFHTCSQAQEGFLVTDRRCRVSASFNVPYP